MTNARNSVGWEYRHSVDTVTCAYNFNGRETFIGYMNISNIVTVTCVFLKEVPVDMNPCNRELSSLESQGWIP